MLFKEINRRFTEIVSEWMGKGFYLNAGSMGGSQGEIAAVDLTDGKRTIRVLISNEVDMDFIERTSIIVGENMDPDFVPNYNRDRWVIWNHRLEVIQREDFYKVAERKDGSPYYGTKEEAVEANQKRRNRCRGRRSDEFKTVKLDPKRMAIAKEAIRRKLGVKRISESQIKMLRANHYYLVSYKDLGLRIQ